MNSEDFNKMFEQAKLMELQIALLTGSDYSKPTFFPTDSQAHSPESEAGYNECYDYETGD
jgi:hypothetical protein